MNRARLFGIIATVLGFVVAVIAGLFIAAQVRGGLTGGGALAGAGVAFVPVALLVGFGLYLYMQGSGDDENDTETDVERQRQLLDIVKARGAVSVNDLAAELDISVADVQRLVRDLAALEVFSGYINWNEGTLYPASSAELEAVTTCRICNSPIDLSTDSLVTCPVCGTEYFRS